MIWYLNKPDFLNVDMEKSLFMWCIFVPKIVAFSTSYATQYNLERFSQEQIIFCWYLDTQFLRLEIWCLYMSLSRFFPGSPFSWVCWTVSELCGLLLRSLWTVSHLSTSDKCPLVCLGSELFSSFFCGQVMDCIAILVLFTMFFVTFHIVFAIVESIDARKHIICQIFYVIVGIFCFCQYSIKIYSAWPVNPKW